MVNKHGQVIESGNEFLGPMGFIKKTKAFFILSSERERSGLKYYNAQRNRFCLVKRCYSKWCSISANVRMNTVFVERFVKKYV